MKPCLLLPYLHPYDFVLQIPLTFEQGLDWNYFLYTDTFYLDYKKLLNSSSVTVQEKHTHDGTCVTQYGVKSQFYIY